MDYKLKEILLELSKFRKPATWIRMINQREYEECGKTMVGTKRGVVQRKFKGVRGK